MARTSACIAPPCVLNRRSLRAAGSPTGRSLYQTARPLRVASAGGVLAPLSAAATVDQAKVLRLASSDIAYLDPQSISDLASTRVANVIFEGLGSR